jgi:EAL domain-containing protein (putative c-di-GMP-specific phosphodiesterase class I)/CheY-like chemotaxis protein
MNPSIPQLKILLIDDDPLQLKLLTRQFSRLGMTDVRGCVDPRLALGILDAAPTAFDVVCCDLQMPETDGVEIVRHLAEIGFRGGLALISGEDPRILRTAERLASSHGLHVLGALHKPAQIEQLVGVLAAAAARPAVREAMPAQYSPDEIRSAIANQEFVNYYQPKVAMADGSVVGVEVLVRWRHPRDGIVGPDRFIEIAEKHGLIDDLTHLVLSGPQGALNQARFWNDAGHPLQVSVNVSMVSLGDHRFPESIAAGLARAGVPPSQLILEVTESRMMGDPRTTLDILTRLRLKRIGLAIDDFGTGHSSLTQLRDAPFDELKIDRGFVHGASRQEDLRAILLPSLDMARQLGIKSVAEGVEDAADWHFLRSCGCDLGQGYFIGRPMPAGGISGWLAEWEARRRVLV